MYVWDSFGDFIIMYNIISDYQIILKCDKYNINLTTITYFYIGASKKHVIYDRNGGSGRPWSTTTKNLSRKLEREQVGERKCYFFLLATEYPRQAFGPTQTNLCALSS